VLPKGDAKVIAPKRRASDRESLVEVETEEVADAA